MNDASKAIEQAFSADAPRFLALDLTEPPATLLVEIKRADHSSFKATRIPTHADATIYAANGGSASLGDLDLKALGVTGVLDAIVRALPVAHAAGLKGDDAALLGGMIVNAAAARHVSRNMEPL